MLDPQKGDNRNLCPWQCVRISRTSSRPRKLGSWSPGSCLSTGCAECVWMCGEKCLRSSQSGGEVREEEGGGGGGGRREEKECRVEKRTSLG